MAVEPNHTAASRVHPRQEFPAPDLCRRFSWRPSRTAPGYQPMPGRSRLADKACEWGFGPNSRASPARAVPKPNQFTLEAPRLIDVRAALYGLCGRYLVLACWQQRGGSLTIAAFTPDSSSESHRPQGRFKLTGSVAGPTMAQSRTWQCSASCRRSRADVRIGRGCLLARIQKS